MEQKIFDKTIFNNVYSLIPYMGIMLNNEACFAITDKNKFIYIKQGGNFKLPYEVEQDVNPTIKLVIDKGKEIIADIPRSKFPDGARCYFFPLAEEGKNVGVLAVAVDFKNKTSLNNIIEILNGSIKQISEAINNVAAGVQKLASMNSDMLEKTNKTASDTKDTKKVVSIIQDISAQTNLLGLNASIEAARAGDSGRGFGVVAEEIRNLSNTSKESINQIDDIIKNISEEIKDIDIGLSKLNDVSQNQSEALEEIAASLADLNIIVNQLNDLAGKI